VIDLNYRMPSIASDFDGGELYADTLHPSNLGHALIGGIAAAALGGIAPAGAYNGPITTLGDTVYGTTSGAPARLAGNTTSTKNFLTQTGNGTNSAAPAWGTIQNGDIPASGVTAGSYTSADITVGADGRVTAASSGSGGGTALTLQESTGTEGYTLIDGTGTILSWTVPNDGNIHTAVISVTLDVTSTETGGAFGISFTAPNGSSAASTISSGGSSAGGHPVTPAVAICEPGSTVYLTQNSALTGGAAVLWATIHGD